MSIIRIPDHAERALARLLTQYRGTHSVPGVLRVLCRQVQEIEDALFAVIAGRALDTATGAQLNNLGRIVGVERASLDDAAFRLRIRAQILVNRRSGESETLIAILAYLAPGSTPILREHFPAALSLEAAGAVIADPTQHANVIDSARAGGVRAVLLYHPQPDDETARLVAEGTGSDLLGTLDGYHGLGDLHLYVTDGTAAFPSEGVLLLDRGLASEEVIRFVSKTADYLETIGTIRAHEGGAIRLVTALGFSGTADTSLGGKMAGAV